MSGLKFCTAIQVFQFAPTRELDAPESPESSTANVDKAIREVAKIIVTPHLGVTFPTSEPFPLTNTWLLLETLNVLPTVEPLVRSFGLAIGPDVVRFASAFGKLGRDRLDEWRDNELIDGILRENFQVPDPIPSAPYATVADCTTETPGFTPVSGIPIPFVYTPDPMDVPYIETIQRWILRETAIVKIKAARMGFIENIPDFNDQQKETYTQLVAGVVRAFVLAVRAVIEGKYSAGIDAQVGSILARGREDQERIRSDFYFDILKLA